MIMPPGQQLLLPANPVFIWLTLLGALLFNLLLNIGGLGRAAWVPDLLAVALVFWCVHQPRRVGVGLAFALGLLMDVHQSALLGQHALAYTVLCYLAIAIHRRLLWFGPISQALQVLPLFATAQFLQVLTRVLAGAAFPGWWLLAPPLLEALLWPVVSVLLLAPQRRAPNQDDHRPL